MQTKANEINQYKVTAKAGEWVAGKRSPGVDKVMKLTDEEARYALIAKEIEPVLVDPAAPAADPETPALPAPTLKPKK